MQLHRKNVKLLNEDDYDIEEQRKAYHRYEKIKDEL